MLNVTQLRERIAVDFPDATQVSESAVRFIRGADSRPYAVCYVDVAKDLPRTLDSLTRYQDQLIGQYYFEGPKSLQWSNYLYFMTTAKRLATRDVQHAKELIEADRSYARKFVIAEDELDAVLSPPVVTATGVEEQPNVLSIWTQRLVEAGLDAAILNEADLPKRLSWIESSSDNLPIPRPKTLLHSRRQPAPPFIRSLQLTKYRPYPLGKEFEFGTVNLIVGPNAAGKTSLLEAIELFYCGRNKRSPDRTAPYELAVVLADGRSEKAATGRRLKTFRDRNLAWYGQPEVKTNNLYQSFAQFNFLDTDAAVDISDSTANIEDDLSKLLVGPDASRIWRNIERVSEALAGRLRELRQLRRQINEELDVLQNRLKVDGGIKQQSDSVAARLNQILGRLGWNRLRSDGLDQAAADLASPLSEMVALAEQASALESVPAPVSLAGLAVYAADARSAIQQAEPAVVRLETLLRERKSLEEAIRRTNEALALAHQATRMIEARIPERSESRTRLLDDIARFGALLAGSDSILMDDTSRSGSETLVACLERSQSQRSRAEQVLEQTRSENSRFTSLRDKSLNLAQQLRQVAGEILKGSPTPDECPLCHTRFGPGELAVHMTLGVDEHMEMLGQTLLSRVKDQESALRNAQNAEAAYRRLREFSDRCGLSADVPVATALTQLATTRQDLADARDHLATLETELQALDAQGLSFARFQAISSQLADLRHPLASPTAEGAATLTADLRQSLSDSQEALERQTTQINEQEGALQDLLAGSDRGLNESKAALSRLKERVATTGSIADGLNAFADSFPWQPESPLAELVVSARSVGTLASDLQVALGRERRDREVQAESIERKQHLDAQIEKLEPRLTRITSAHDTLRALMDENSLNAAMESALAQNRAGIESIFSRIHAPAEFSGLGSKFDTLLRKGNGGEASLREISTGQRAAFALSIFLAQNSQLAAAPPVMLIDDPIAHVDDLNSLSFLDYLREIAIRGQRQIFFATANDKIASLFERKFDFLGEDGFRKIGLSREPS